MLSFRQYGHSFLEEGAFKLPTRLKKTIHRLVAANVLWYARGQMNDIRKRGRDTSEWDKEINRLIGKYKVANMLPRKRWSSGPSGVNGAPMPFRMDDMPDNYKDALPEDFGQLMVGIDWGGRMMGKSSTNSGEWNPKGKTIILNPWAIPGLMTFFSQEGDGTINLDYAVSKLMNTGDHELTHAIQDTMAKHINNKKQIHQKKSYEAGGEDYYTSRVEFEAMIKSKAFEFVNNKKVGKMLRKGKKSKYSDRDMLDVFVAAKKGGGLFGLQPDPFFVALKKNSPKRWKDAIKKFLIIYKKQKVFDLPHQRSNK